MAGIGSLKASAAVPLGADGRPLPSAQDIVAVFPYPTESDPLAGFAAAFALRWGFSLVTVHFPMHPNGVPVDPDRFYYYPASGSDQAWLAAVATLRSTVGLPSTRRLLAFGRSGGAAAALHFANAHPEQVEAVVAEAPRAIPEQARIRCPVLLVHGEDDYVRESNLRLEACLRQMGTYVLRAAFHPAYERREAGAVAFSHGANAPAVALMETWLVDIANARIDRERDQKTVWSMRQGSATPFPGERSADAWECLPPEIVEYRKALVALPARNRPAKARVILLGEGMSVQPDELRYGIQQLADGGFVAASAGADGSSASQAVRRALEALESVATGSGLRTFVITLDEASDEAPDTSCRFDGIILAGLSGRGRKALPGWVSLARALAVVGHTPAPAGLPTTITYMTAPALAAAAHRPRLLHTRQIATAMQFCDRWLER